MLGSTAPAREGLRLPATRAAGAVALVLVATLYFAAGKLGLALAYVHASASAVWPPAGIALAALLVLGTRVWPAILVGAFLVNVTTAGSAATSAAIAAGNTLECLAGALLVQRYAGGLSAFDRPRDIARFVLLAATSTTLSATLGVTSLALAGFAAWDEFARIWRTWWLGDATGILIVAPALVLWAALPRPRFSPVRLAEAALLAGGGGVTAWLVFHGSLSAPFTFLCLPFPVWAAFRFGQRGAATTTVMLSAVAVWGTWKGLGPFVGATPNESLVSLQAFAGILSVLTLTTAAAVQRHRRLELELSRARDELAQRVTERTESLSWALARREQEVAERERAERGLRDSELRLHGLLEAAPDAMVLVDSAGTITQLNTQAETMFGFARDELIGRSVERLIPPSVGARHAEHRRAFAADPGTRPMGAGRELFATRRDGTEFPVEISLSPLRTDAGLLVMAAIRDITERKNVDLKLRRMNLELERGVRERTAELERSNEALRQFAYAASHDLQEPLRTMGNYAEILAERYRGRLDADADVFIGFIVDGAEWMNQLLQGLLAYAGVDTQPPQSAPASMDVALDHALENLGAAIEATAARVTREPLPTVLADEVQVVQLFQNLVGNAIKFRRPATPPEVHVEAVRRGPKWVVSVRDNGIGIDGRHAERVFAVFQRLHRRAEYPGTGIGLAICKKIVERHGGRIWIESQPGQGSTFLFTLPAAVTEGP